MCWDAGTGKSVSATMWLKDYDDNCLVVCPKKIVEKWRVTLVTWGKVATVMSKEEFKKTPITKYDAIVIDECFVKNTQVLTLDGYKNIQDIKINDIVVNAIKHGKVTKTHKNVVKETIKIKFSNNTEIEVTPNHLIFTQKGWVKAVKLNKTHQILDIYFIHDIINKYEKLPLLQYSNNKREKRQNLLFKNLCKIILHEKKNRITKRQTWYMFVMQKINLCRLFWQKNKKILLTILCFKTHAPTKSRNWKKNWNIFIYKTQKSKSQIKKFCFYSKNEKYFKKNWSQTKNTWRKWSNYARASKSFTIGIRGWVVRGAFCFNIFKSYKNWLSNMLQNRCSKPKKEDSNRNRWFITSIKSKTRTRQKEDIFFNSIRVESIEIQKSGNYEVFNLSVDGHPSYVVNNMLTHNCDEFFSPLYIARMRSQLSERLYNQLKTHPCPLLLTTATPIRSNPANLHTAITFLGHNVLWKDWRNKYYELTKKPYMQFTAWLPKPNWRKIIQDDLKKYAHIVNMKDCVDLPPVTIEKIAVKTPKYVQGDEHNFYTEHQHEQQNKIQYIKDIAKGHRKLFIVAYYVEQIEELKRQLEKDRPTFVLYGKTKDQEEVIRQAQESDDCYFVVQSGTGAGFDADTFSCMVFASMGFAVRDWVQMKARIRRIHNLQPVKYVYLQGGRADKRVLSNIESGRDFIPSEFI